MSKWIEFLITFFLGIFGVHKFMQKNIKMGLIYFFTLGFFGFGWAYDTVRVLIDAIRGTKLMSLAEKKALLGIGGTICVLFIVFSSLSDEYTAVYFLYFVGFGALLYRTSVIQKQEKEIKAKAAKLRRQLKKSDLKPIEPKHLVLLPDEVCYLEEKAFVGNLAVENEIYFRDGMVFVTDERIILKFPDHMLIKNLNEITYIGDINVKNNRISVQFGIGGYAIQTPNSEIVKLVLQKVIKSKQEDKSKVICEYCGVSNVKEDKKCSNCGAPLGEKVIKNSKKKS